MKVEGDGILNRPLEVVKSSTGDDVSIPFSVGSWSMQGM
jgi:hypothetical protein